MTQVVVPDKVTKQNITSLKIEQTSETKPPLYHRLETVNNMIIVHHTGLGVGPKIYL